MSARLAPLAREAALAFVDLILPVVCAACERPIGRRDAGIICGHCWSRLPLLPHPQCDRCGHPMRDTACRWCELLPAYVRAARSVCWVPDAVSSSIVHALKYDGWEPVADAMGERMARLAWPDDVRVERGGLIPVPLAAVRERERGFNQSERLASALARRWKLPLWSSALRRTRATRSQTRLTPEERRHNVAGVFEVCAEEPRTLHGAHLVLVDDVLTTAATLNACAAALIAAGARIVSYVTFGRAPAAGDRESHHIPLR